jgi:hypothetical protein
MEHTDKQIFCETCIMEINGEGQHIHEQRCKLELQRKEIEALKDSIIRFEDKIEEYINEFGSNAPNEVCAIISEQIQLRRHKRNEVVKT